MGHLQGVKQKRGAATLALEAAKGCTPTIREGHAYTCHLQPAFIATAILPSSRCNPSSGFPPRRRMQIASAERCNAGEGFSCAVTCSSETRKWKEWGTRACAEILAPTRGTKGWRWAASTSTSRSEPSSSKSCQVRLLKLSLIYRRSATTALWQLATPHHLHCGNSTSTPIHPLSIGIPKLLDYGVR